MTGRTAPSSDDLLAEVFGVFPGYKANADLCTAPGTISLTFLSLATDVADVTLGASGLWLGIRTEADGTATLA